MLRRADDARCLRALRKASSWILGIGVLTGVVGVFAGLMSGDHVGFILGVLGGIIVIIVVYAVAVLFDVIGAVAARILIQNNL